MRTLLSLILLFQILFTFGQGNARATKTNRTIEKQTLFGIQISPIIPTNFLEKSNYQYESDTVNYSIQNHTSVSYGVEIRHYFTYRFALNTGILYTKRNIDVDFSSQHSVSNKKLNDTTFTRQLQFTAFEIPIKASGYVRLSKQIYMSIAGGIHLNFYPSDIRVDNVYMQRAEHFGLNAFQFFQLGISGSLGWEYRTQNSGIFFIGASYQTHINNMAYVLLFEEETIHNADYFEPVKGSYFSIDIKYFFPFNEKNRK